MKKIGGKKSRDTIPLRGKHCEFPPDSIFTMSNNIKCTLHFKAVHRPLTPCLASRVQ
jgi:hypothetical protein